MQYSYAWYEMLGLMILAGVVIFAFARGLDLALERFLDVMAARRDKRADRGA